VAGSGSPATFDEGVVSLDDLFGEHCGVTAGGFQVQVAEQGRDDMQGQSRTDEFRGE
jgi:hypothetical protein